MAERRVPIEPQSVDAPLTSTAVFLTLVVADHDGAADTVRSVLGSLSDVLKNVAIRALDGRLAVTAGVGSAVWDAVMRAPKPAELHPFREIRGAVHTAVATPGDILLHIRADRRDLCFELERQLVDLLGDAVTVADETWGFRSFDTRDLLGFVDGTADPVGPALLDSTIVGDDDPAGEGGSYLVVQKYVHPLAAWNRVTVEHQQDIVGRTKLENIELPDATGDAQKSHKTLTTIVDDAGVEHDILRDNMPFGSPGEGVYGTYFIGYARELWVVERMLERMFVGDPPGRHDRILDFSTALTGATFFVPSATALDALGD